MIKVKEKNIVISFQADKGLNDLIEKYAKETRQPKSRFIREAVLAAISKLIDEKEKTL